MYCSKVCQPGDAPVELCADERVGGPLLLEPLIAEVEVSHMLPVTIVVCILASMEQSLV